MHVDPSAVLAILKEEPDAAVFRNRLMAAPVRAISIVGKVEAAIALGKAMRNYDLAPQVVTAFCEDANVVVSPVYPDLFEDALTAYKRYGKGTGHPARLNFGDCFSYAFAKRDGVPLLFKGQDFARTDVEPAI